jgi:tousled-like kinase
MDQKNKITSYFRPNPSTEPSPPQPYENLTSFAQASLLIKTDTQPPEPPLPGKWEMILKEKEKEMAMVKRLLRAKEEQLEGFQTKTKAVVSGMVVELEEHRRAEKRRFISAEKWRVGEYITFRDGAHLKEVWENGFEIRQLKEKLQEISQQKEHVEALKKKLKKRTGKVPPTDDKQFIGNHNNMERPPMLGFSANSDGGLSTLAMHRHQSNQLKELRLTGSIYKNPGGNAEFSDSSNTYSLWNEKAVEENRERLNSRILILTKEENYYKEKIDGIERQKETYVRLSKQLFEEENCRFGRTTGDPENRWPLLKGRYQLVSLMGKGGFSEVYKAFDLEEMKDVACKIHQLSQSWSENFKSNYIKHALRENQVHKNLVHPNIVSHLDSVEIDSNSFCAVLEFCNGPDLATYLRKYKTIPEKDSKSIVKQIVSGLKFLNETSRKIIHYDLKPQNILFHDGLIKISDFGLCKVMDEDQTRLDLTSQGVGTYWYLPPECFYHNYPKISTKVDVWSVGVILFELLYGIKPFGNDMCQEKILKEGIMLRAYTLDFPPKPSVSTELREVIRKFLEYNQEERPDVMEAWNMLNKL